MQTPHERRETVAAACAQLMPALGLREPRLSAARSGSRPACQHGAHVSLPRDGRRKSARVAAGLARRRAGPPARACTRPGCSAAPRAGRGPTRIPRRPQRGTRCVHARKGRVRIPTAGRLVQSQTPAAASPGRVPLGPSGPAAESLRCGALCAPHTRSVVPSFGLPLRFSITRTLSPSPSESSWARWSR